MEYKDFLTFSRPPPATAKPIVFASKSRFAGSSDVSGEQRAGSDDRDMPTGGRGEMARNRRSSKGSSKVSGKLQPALAQADATIESDLS